MGLIIKRSINEPIRENLSFDERWKTDDRGLVTSWEAGRELAQNNSNLSQQACDGELVELPWKRGSWRYLAMWQGLRGEDLNINTTEQIQMIHRYVNEKGKQVSRVIKFPESGTCPENLRTLKEEDRIRDLYFDQ